MWSAAHHSMVSCPEDRSTSWMPVSTIHPPSVWFSKLAMATKRGLLTRYSARAAVDEREFVHTQSRRSRRAMNSSDDLVCVIHDDAMAFSVAATHNVLKHPSRIPWKAYINRVRVSNLKSRIPWIF